MPSQDPDDKESDGASSEADCPDIVGGYLIVAVISSEMRDAGVGNSIDEVFIK